MEGASTLPYGIPNLRVGLQSPKVGITSLWWRSVGHTHTSAQAPLDSAWEGQTVGYVCRQIQDKERNGGMDHQDLIHHMTEDPLVAWSWTPGGNREPVPGTLEQFGELVKAWIATGGACPE